MGCSDYEWSDSRQKRYDETKWKLHNSFVCSSIQSINDSPWTCTKCFSLIEAAYCRRHRQVCK